MATLFSEQTEGATPIPSLKLWARRPGRRKRWELACVGTKQECAAAQDKLIRTHAAIDVYETPTDTNPNRRRRP
jgi:hypothetical protein